MNHLHTFINFPCIVVAIRFHLGLYIYIFGINNDGNPRTTSSGDVKRCKFDVFVRTASPLYRSIVFIASNPTSAIWNNSATRSLLVLSRMATIYLYIFYQIDCLSVFEMNAELEDKILKSF